LDTKIDKIITIPWVSNLLNRPILARLATADPSTGQPHVVPVWFEWDEGSLWVSAFRSTRKVKTLMKNPLVSIVIDTEENSRGILFEGRAEMVTEPSKVRGRSTSIYTRYLGPEGVLAPDPQSWIVDPENLIIKLTPSRACTWGESED
jgi:nitroimidazol reductase NimA-like FMN-containing flavoprotein (pyridoxamine 5'-phosphate oxidase superfamily)